jgi:hypothetical protein
MYTLKNRPDKLIIVYHDDDKTGATYAAVLYEKGFDNVYLLTGGIDEFYQKKPELVIGKELPPLQSEIGKVDSSEKLKVADQKPRIRKTKEELILENELQFQKRKVGISATTTGSQGFRTTNENSKGFTKKPSFNLDPAKCNTNSKFDDIPDHQQSESSNFKKMPPKPKGVKPASKKDAKEERPLTDKLTNIAIDTKNNTAYNVERKIDRLHTDKKEVTQKPNFGIYQPQRTQSREL